MNVHQMKVDIHYSDGTEKKIGLSLGVLVAYEIAFNQSFGKGVGTMQGQAWVTWRQCQKIDPDTPSFEDWAETVDRLYFDIPNPQIVQESG